MKLILKDTFNDRTISTHRTLKAAVIAQRKHSRAVERCNGKGSYIPTEILHADGSKLTIDEHEEMFSERMRIDQSR